MTHPAAFRHEALLHDGDDRFAAGAVAFVRDGLSRGEPVQVMLRDRSAGLLQEALGADRAGVRFVSLDEVGHNPALVLPAWREFAAGAARGGRCRGIAEPVGAARAGPERIECERHEALLNVAFAGGPGLWLMCPYDVAALDPEVVADARRNHPHVVEGGARRPSPDYVDPATVPPAARFGAELPEPPAPARPRDLEFGRASLRAVRAFAASEAVRVGAEARLTDVVLAADELAANTIRHATGVGRVRVWQEGGRLVCEVQDEGVMHDPLVGRLPPTGDPTAGRGLWMLNHVCDLVQIRSSPRGTTVRAHISC